MRRITWHDEANGIVEAEAGINLRWDPENPSSTKENGLLQQLSDKGWTLLDLGGIVAQTVGGFLSTGSSGGALDPERSLEKNIEGFTFVDGNGELQRVDQEDDLYPAIGVSMGLLGIITSVRFKCTKLFSVQGEENWTTEKDCEIDLFGPGEAEKRSLQTFIKEEQYTRILWYPAIDKVGVWKAAELEEHPKHVKPYINPQHGTDDEECIAGIFGTITGNLQDLSNLPRNIEPLLMCANKLLDKRGTNIHDVVKIKMGNVDNEVKQKGAIGKALENIMTTLLRDGAGALACIPGIEALGKLLFETRASWVPAIMKDFIGNAKEPHVEFRDYVWKIIPMDQDINYVLEPIFFTELWIPLHRTEEVMKKLREYMGGEDVSRRDFKKTGWLAFELYGASTSPFWLSPSSAGPMFRVDILWFGYNGGDPSQFFNQYFELLNEFDFKVHWGKFKPVNTGDGHDQTYWSSRFQSLYNRHDNSWTKFMRARAECDPENMFLTDYWRQHLGLQDVKPNYADPPIVEPVPWIYSEEWRTATRWIMALCLLVFFGSFFGVGAAHLPAIMGHPWSSCEAYNNVTKEGFKQRGGCIFAYHLIQVPIFLLFMFFSLYGFYISCKTVPYGTSLSAMRAHTYNFHSIFTMTMSIAMVFALIEVDFVFDSFRRAAPTWETGLLIVLSSTLESSVTFGLVVLFKLNTAMLLIQRSSDNNACTNPNMVIER